MQKVSPGIRKLKIKFMGRSEMRFHCSSFTSCRNDFMNGWKKTRNEQRSRWDSEKSIILQGTANFGITNSMEISTGEVGMKKQEMRFVTASKFFFRSLFYFVVMKITEL